MCQRPYNRDSNPTSVRNFFLENPCAFPATGKLCGIEFLLKGSIENLVLNYITLGKV